MKYKINIELGTRLIMDHRTQNGMKELSDEDKLFYYERNFFTLDGLWMIEVEEEFGWDKALEIDNKVWFRLLKATIRRLKKYLKIETNNADDLVEMLAFRWSAEKWGYNIIESRNDFAKIEIVKCPYQSMMSRNPERVDRIPLICKNMCIPFYASITKDFNENIELERKSFMGLGGKICDFHFKMK